MRASILTIAGMELTEISRTQACRDSITIGRQEDLEEGRREGLREGKQAALAEHLPTEADETHVTRLGRRRVAWVAVPLRHSAQEPCHSRDSDRRWSLWSDYH
jgi:hypothetical protein